MSKGDNEIHPDEKNHPFAKDGFRYRTAYFMDNDGQYYKLRISVGHNGEVKTVYNVGRIKEAQFPRGSKAHQPKTDIEIGASKETVPQNKESVKQEFVYEDEVDKDKNINCHTDNTIKTYGGNNSGKKISNSVDSGTISSEFKNFEHTRRGNNEDKSDISFGTAKGNVLENGLSEYEKQSKAVSKGNSEESLGHVSEGANGADSKSGSTADGRRFLEAINKGDNKTV